MNKKNIIYVVCVLILFGVIVRLLPHEPNMTPITAIAFVGSLYLGKKWALVMPLLILLFSDLLIGFYDWKIVLFVYGSFALIGMLSFVALKFRAVLPVGLLVIGSSILFFLITNMAVWAFSPWYEKTISGLLYSYELGLPFFRNMLIGDILYTLALVSLFEVGHFLYRWRHDLLNALRVTIPSPIIYNKLN
jgi:hypothetical protein